MNLSISQWNWWKIEIMFWENSMKPRIRYRKISIYDHFHSNFHIKKDLNIEFKLVLFENVIFISYRIVSYQYQIVSYQFLVLILWSPPCLNGETHKHNTRWLNVSRLKASAICSLKNHEMQTKQVSLNSGQVLAPVANPIKLLWVKLTRIQLFYYQWFFWWILQVNISMKNSLETFWIL